MAEIEELLVKLKELDPETGTGEKQCTRCHESKPINEFDVQRRSRDGLQCWCKTCRRDYRKAYREHNIEHVRKIERESNYRAGRGKPMMTNPDCGVYLGIYIAERVLAGVFGHINRMPNNNQGYDFICGKGYKVDVKSATLSKYGPNSWSFTIRKNTTADYFLILAFDNRRDLNPEHIWMIPGVNLSMKEKAMISRSTLDKWAQWERPIERVIACCDRLKGET